MNQWKKISTKEILNHPRLTVFEDEIELPNGKRTEYIRFGSQNCVTIICKNNENKILIQKEYSYPPNKVLFQFPGGGIFESEDIAKAANRELQEEADFKADKLTLLGDYYTNNRRSDSKMTVYLAEDLTESSLPKDDEEHFESFWFTEQEIDDLINKQEIKNCNLLAAWAMYKAFNKEN